MGGWFISNWWKLYQPCIVSFRITAQHTIAQAVCRHWGQGMVGGGGVESNAQAVCGGVPLFKMSVWGIARTVCGSKRDMGAGLGWGGTYQLLKLSPSGGKGWGGGGAYHYSSCLWGQEKGEREYHCSSCLWGQEKGEREYHCSSCLWGQEKGETKGNAITQAVCGGKRRGKGNAITQAVCGGKRRGKGNAIAQAVYGGKRRGKGNSITQAVYGGKRRGKGNAIAQAVYGGKGIALLKVTVCGKGWRRGMHNS